MLKLNKKYLFGLIPVLAASIYYLKNSNEDARILYLKSQKNIQGFEVSPQLFNTEYLIINFWATWCPPCIEETPSLIEFSKNHPEFKLIAISQDDDLKTIQDFIKLFPNFKNNNIEVVYDQTKSISRKFNIEKLPESFIYSFKKNKYIQISGATNWNEPEIIKNILLQFEKK